MSASKTKEMQMQGLKRNGRLHGVSEEKWTSQQAKTASAQFSGKYLSLPTEEESRNRVATFIDSTGNEALARCVCIVCARELLRGEGQ